MFNNTGMLVFDSFICDRHTIERIILQPSCYAEMLGQNNVCTVYVMAYLEVMHFM